MLDDLIKDSRAIDLIETLDFQTECGKKQFLHDLHTPITSDINILKKKQESIRFQRSTMDIATSFDIVKHSS